MRRLFVLLSLVGALSACGAEPAPPPTTTAPPPTTTSAGGLDPTDAAYVQLAIPQAESALPLLDAVRARATDPALAELATRAGVGHRGELTELHGVLERAGATYLNQHEGHDMPGMVTRDEVVAADRLAGAEFDAEARVLLRRHFEESAAVARSELAAGADAGLLELTGRIERARADYLSKLSVS
ncbi:DUF305 domain-containing protein [Saccharothrix syringae]|uniref:DUF305 domain-containing protein n=1 Tax=Saccharothrix syringae TaxID=103733 RepID=UPI0005253F16|nr:DUF305 domain-containing protein [Saccharothrix syringae]